MSGTSTVKALAVERSVMGAGSAPECPQCGAPLSSRHCKYVCPNHGVVFDCSDPFN